MTSPSLFISNYYISRHIDVSIDEINLSNSEKECFIGVSLSKVNNFYFYYVNGSNTLRYSIIFSYGQYGRLSYYSENSLHTLFSLNKGPFDHMDIYPQSTVISGKIDLSELDESFLDSLTCFINNSNIIDWFTYVEFKCDKQIDYDLDKLKELIKLNASKSDLFTMIKTAKENLKHLDSRSYQFNKDLFVKVIQYFLINSKGKLPILERLFDYPKETIILVLEFLTTSKALKLDEDNCYIVNGYHGVTTLQKAISVENEHNLDILFSDYSY